MGRRVFQGVLFGLVLLLTLAFVGERLGWIVSGLPRGAAQGREALTLRADVPMFWLASRALGFTAYAALALEVILGLFLSTNLANGWIAKGRTVELHRWLSLVAVGLTAGHAFALLGDRTVKFDVVSLLIPFASGYRPVAVGVGIIAAYSMLVVHFSFDFRARLGAAVWRSLHYLSFAAFAGATAHGILAGTDAKTFWARGVYTAAAGLVLWLTFYRIVQSAGSVKQGARPTLSTESAVSNRSL